eukprot:4772867-Pleurochrysis_carterae.AAC.1
MPLPAFAVDPASIKCSCLARCEEWFSASAWHCAPPPQISHWLSPCDPSPLPRRHPSPLITAHGV